MGLFGLALSVCACGGNPGPSHAALEELERLAFVPAGESDLPRFPPSAFRAAAKEALVVDRFEVRVRDFDPAVTAGELGSEAALERPARADWFAATAFAAERGMRLPTVSEWIYIASGHLGHAYPWGQNLRRSVANTLELGLLRSAPVGAFESGRGPFGTYDQIGNVWEWASDHAPGVGVTLGEEAGIDAGPELGLRSVLGGSYLTRIRPLFPPAGAPPVFAMSHAPGHQAPDIGLRCVAEARRWLAEHAAGLDPSTDAERARLEAIGAGWYQTGEGQLVALLESLSLEFRGKPGAKALAALTRGARP